MDNLISTIWSNKLYTFIVNSNETCYKKCICTQLKYFNTFKIEKKNKYNPVNNIKKLNAVNNLE